MNKKLLFVVTEDWYFCSHRLNLAKQAIEDGFDVTVATHVQKHRKVIQQAGITLIPLKCMNRGSMNPWKEIKSITELVRIYRAIRPDIVHHVAMKPILYGSIAALLTGVQRKIQAITGFGFVFLSHTLKAKLLRFPVRCMLRFVLRGKLTDVIVQNPDDVILAKAIGVRSEHVHFIAGSGVDTEIFFPSVEPENDNLKVTLVARMLWDKGIGEFVEAVRLLKEKGVQLEAKLVGEPDDSNPASIPLKQLQAWDREGVVQYCGRRSDIANVWAETNIAILPSYREGLPKSLLEAAACGRAMIATDVPGCNLVVKHGQTGFLVPVKDAHALANAIHELMLNTGQRKRFAKNARAMAETCFSDDMINQQVVRLYQKVSH